MLQVDGYAGYKRMAGERADRSVQLAFCWAHMRRTFFELHASTKSPIAAELLARVAALNAIEAEIRGHPAEHRQRVRSERSRPIVEGLHGWLGDQLPRISGASDLAKAMRYALRHWPGLIAFFDDGRIEMDTNVVERAIRPITLARKNALFAGSDGGAPSLANRDDVDPNGEVERRGADGVADRRARTHSQWPHEGDRDEGVASVELEGDCAKRNTRFGRMSGSAFEGNASER